LTGGIRGRGERERRSKGKIESTGQHPERGGITRYLRKVGDEIVVREVGYSAAHRVLSIHL